MKKAFTLIEAVMVMLIIGILGVVVITDFSRAYKVVKLEGVAERVKNDIAYARLMAITQYPENAGTMPVFGVIFFPASGFYSVYSAPYNSSSSIVTDSLRGLGAPFTVDYNTDFAAGDAVIMSTSFGSPTTDKVEFDKMGVPYSNGGANPLIGSGTVTLSYDGSSSLVTVTKNTGKVN